MPPLPKPRYIPQFNDCFKIVSESDLNALVRDETLGDFSDKTKVVTQLREVTNSVRVQSVTLIKEKLLLPFLSWW